jgi:hypothetical protein
MIAIVKHFYDAVIDSAKFAAAVWHDARTMQAQAEEKYGHLGF